MSDCLNVQSGPCAPIPQPGYVPGAPNPSFAGNNISASITQSQDVNAVLTMAAPAFTVVKSVSGGMQPVDPNTPADQSQIFGVTLSAGAAGQTVPVRPFGVIFNLLAGMLAWNWTLGAPIYVGAAGVLTATPNATGWNEVVGYAIAQTGILFHPNTVDSANAPITPNTDLLGWAYAGAFEMSAVTRTVNGAVQTATIVWPDGATGTLTADAFDSTNPGLVTAWHATHTLLGVTRTVTQPAMTYNAQGDLTAQPAITIS